MSGLSTLGGGLLLLPLLALASTALAAPNGKVTFETYCAACHGLQGRGDGPASASLQPKPRNFTDQTWWEGRENAAIVAVVTKGGAANGLSPLMPAWGGALKDKEIDAVVAYLRSNFAGAKPPGAKPSSP